MSGPHGHGPAEAPARQRLLAVVGPTASGKSELAMALAERCGGEVINTDSMQVYRHFDIGTAKPGPAERARVPHHLLDLADPDEHYSAGRYVADAERVLAGLRARGRVPVLCGGTGLYFRALLFGLAPVPAVPPGVRAGVQARVAARGAPACHAELVRVDPEAGAAIHPNDGQRIARALGVYEATGRPLSAYRRDRPFRAGAPHVLSVGYAWERAALYERIDRRVEAMLERGGDRAALAAAIAQRTRHYAKRQLTWFRRHPEVRWWPPGDAAGVEVAAKKFLITGERGG